MLFITSSEKAGCTTWEASTGAWLGQKASDKLYSVYISLQEHLQSAVILRFQACERALSERQIHNCKGLQFRRVLKVLARALSTIGSSITPSAWLVRVSVCRSGVKMHVCEQRSVAAGCSISSVSPSSCYCSKALGNHADQRICSIRFPIFVLLRN